MWAFEEVVRKGENAGNKDFSPYLKMFTIFNKIASITQATEVVICTYFDYGRVQIS